MGEWSKAQRELSLEVTEKNLYPYKEPDKIIETLRHASVHKNEQSDFFPENIGVSSSISRQKGPRIQASDKEIWEMLRFLTAWLFSGFVYGGAVGEEKFISVSTWQAEIERWKLINGWSDQNSHGLPEGKGWLLLQKSGDAWNNVRIISLMMNYNWTVTARNSHLPDSPKG